jgi:adenosylcobinamide-GDP ribazoletransferase
MFAALGTAIRTLTILPIPGKDTTHFTRTLVFFPAVGALLGSLIPVLHKGAELLGLESSLLLAALALAGMTWLTGCLHIDGLGDVADAFGGGRNREQILHILKDPRMGSFGICAIAFDVLVKISCWQILFEQGRWAVVFWSLVFGRSLQALTLLVFPNARGESIAGPFGRAGAFDKGAALFSFLVAGFMAAWLESAYHAVVYGGCAVIVTLFWGLYCWRKIGGITGDCLGAANELAEVGVLLGGIVFLNEL